jgi:hypothetical protein
MYFFRQFKSCLWKKFSVMSKILNVIPNETPSDTKQDHVTNTNDVEFVLSKEQLSQTLVIFGPSSPSSIRIKRHIYLLTPSNQNPSPDMDAMIHLNQLSKLVKQGVRYPKLTIVLPPMKLRMKPICNSWVEDYNHIFWLVATTDGMSESALATFGGADNLRERQMSAYNLMYNASIQLERKRFFHPDSLEELKLQTEENIPKYQSIRPGITYAEILETLFMSRIMNHDQLRIMSNLPGNNNNKAVISVLSKVWYKPNKTPTKDDNEYALQEYLSAAKTSEPPFKVNDSIIAGLRHGFRLRRVPVYGKCGNKFVLQDHPLDPMKFPFRNGDFVIATLTCNLYEMQTIKGQTWHVEKLCVVSQVNTKQSQEFCFEPAIESKPPQKHLVNHQTMSNSESSMLLNESSVNENSVKENYVVIENCVPIGKNNQSCSHHWLCHCFIGVLFMILWLELRLLF